MPAQEAEGRTDGRHQHGAHFREADMAQSEIIFEVHESPEGGFEARALGFSIFTEADSFAELKDLTRDAVWCHFEDDEKPLVIRLHLVRDEVISS
jgi:hypothetical protein